MISAGWGLKLGDVFRLIMLPNGFSWEKRAVGQIIEFWTEFKHYMDAPSREVALGYLRVLEKNCQMI